MLRKMKIMALKKVKLQMMNICLTLQRAVTVHLQTLCFKRVRERKLLRKRFIRFRRRLSGFLVVNTNQWLLMQKAFVLG